MTVLEGLKAGRELISDRNRWTKYHYAEDEYGNAISWNDPDACRFCSIGALRKVGALEETEGFLSNAMGEYVVVFNDDNNHELVLAAWDRAISEEQARTA